MPRKPRELVDGGIYHVFNRGNDRMDLFLEENDYEYFLNQLLVEQRRTNSEVYHYCLMTNHYHLLLRITKAEILSKLMHGLQLAYTRYFKKKYRFLGHLFQQRFRSPRIPENSYYLQCGRYIERNPVKAGILKDPWNYPYSSASFYASGKHDELITPNLYYESMGDTSEIRQRNYREFLSIDEPYGDMIDAQFAKV